MVRCHAQVEVTLTHPLHLVAYNILPFLHQAYSVLSLSQKVPRQKVDYPCA
ncbi:hypothetical protein CAL7102_09195 [Dulcicalothrix desertica PCC 7102]|nr:hypothetical protein CAL7102_09195 [Dulcicalothrix desertica PCC 7102]